MILEKIEDRMQLRAKRRQRQIEDDMSFEYRPSEDTTWGRDEKPEEAPLPFWAKVLMAIMVVTAMCVIFGLNK